MDQLDKVVHVDQGPIGRTPRSNPATYTGVFDHIRKLFAATTEAKVRGYQPGRFSFNVKGGRCEACAGDGTIKIEMQFLPDVYVPCEVCHGARYNTDTLQVHYKGKSIAEVLDMPIEEAATSSSRPCDPPAPEDPQRGRPRLRPARPARHHAVRRRGAARQALHGVAAALHGPDRGRTARRGARAPRRPGGGDSLRPRRGAFRRAGDRVSGRPGRRGRGPADPRPVRGEAGRRQDGVLERAGRGVRVPGVRRRAPARSPRRSPRWTG